MAATGGYSGTPLLKKLGIKPGMKLLLINEPANYYKLLEQTSAINAAVSMKYPTWYTFLGRINTYLNLHNGVAANHPIESIDRSMGILV